MLQKYRYCILSYIYIAVLGVWFLLAALYVTRVAESLECFSCLNITAPNDCRATIRCSSGQYCFSQTFQADTDLRYNMGCQTNQQCTSAAVNTNGIIGRSISTRQQYSCHECCSSDNCNAYMCVHAKPSECKDDETIDCARMSSIFNLCADVHHAKITCPKFCGLCQLVDGNWAEWSVWSLCSVTCENGTMTRKRTCTNPSPSNGGLNCSGSAVDSKMCTLHLCPVHGNWTSWSVWSGCSVSCDVGLRKRSRTCTNPKPDPFGDYCVGDPVEYTVCLNDPCDAKNGGWSSWHQWQSCSVTCGLGRKLRDRTCTNPSPTAYGKDCPGNSMDFDVCVNTPCTVVTFNAHGRNVLSNLVMTFPTVISNVGNAYNPNTGHFTAPVDGIYYFTVQICKTPDHYINFSIEKGDTNMSEVTRLSNAVESVQGNEWSCITSSTSVKLRRNEHVWVLMASQYADSVIHEHVDAWNSFTGTLIQEV